MKEFRVTADQEGQALFKFAAKILEKAPAGLLHKWLRKKTIDVNRKKCTGKEILRAGDEVHMWLSDDTFQAFAVPLRQKEESREARCLAECILYEDRDWIAVDKPAGLLSQKDREGGESLNDWLLAYTGTEAGLRPSICSRLDRNTSGLLLCGKTMGALQTAARLLKSRRIHKYYRAWVLGKLPRSGRLEGYMKKDASRNQVRVRAEGGDGWLDMETVYHAVQEREVEGAVITECELLLVTGRTHQLRAHLSSIGHPILGDRKYGTKASMVLSEKLRIRRHLLHAARMEFPEDPALGGLSGGILTAPRPFDFQKLDLEKTGGGAR